MGGPAVFLTSSGLVVIIVEDFNIFGQFGFEDVTTRLAAEFIFKSVSYWCVKNH